MVLRKTLICEYIRKSLRANFFLSTPFQNTSIEFPLGPWGMQAPRLVLGSWSLKQCQIWAPSHGVDFKYNQILVGCFTSIVLHCPSIYYRQNTIVDQRVCGYIGFFHRSSPHYPLSFSFKKGKPLLCITSAPLCASTHCKTIACKFHYDIFNV